MYNPHLGRLDTHFPKLCKSIVGPPPGTDWTLEWHEILHQWILEDRTVPISQRLRYFDAVVSSSVACFAGGHRTIHTEHIQTLDFHFRKFCRSIVGPPRHID